MFLPKVAATAVVIGTRTSGGARVEEGEALLANRNSGLRILVKSKTAALKIKPIVAQRFLLPQGCPHH